VFIVDTPKARKTMIKRSKLPLSKSNHGPGEIIRMNANIDSILEFTVTTARVIKIDVTATNRINPSNLKFKAFKLKKFINSSRNNPY
jgi:hypothetical protein